ncbi:hypothetical protein PFISCL1PPCAC_11638, partial [Pristionchus fissidentatus]
QNFLRFKNYAERAASNDLFGLEVRPKSRCWSFHHLSHFLISQRAIFSRKEIGYHYRVGGLHNILSPSCVTLIEMEVSQQV